MSIDSLEITQSQVATSYHYPVVMIVIMLNKNLKMTAVDLAKTASGESPHCIRL